jgi:hypothetical protein
MAVVRPRPGASLTRVVQAALNAAGSAHVSIVTAGPGQGVELPDEHVAAVHQELGWDTEADDAQAEADPPHPPPSPAPDPAPGDGEHGAVRPPAAPVPDPGDQAPPAPPAPAQRPPAVPKKTVSSARRHRRTKEQ